MKNMAGKKILILGGGTAGTIMAHHLCRQKSLRDWHITLVDESPDHIYQPGLLFVPFGKYTLPQITRKKQNLLPKRVSWMNTGIEAISPETDTVHLQGGIQLAYDILIVATGCRTVPSETAGLEGDGWLKNVFDFYSPAGAAALFPALQNFTGGDLVVHITEMPIKCPVAPLEFTLLADWFLTKKGIRSKTHLSYVTPLSGAFTKPVAAKVLGDLLERRNISVVPEFHIEQIDPAGKKMISYGGTEVPYDLLVTVPTNMGSPAVEKSGFGDELHFIPTDPGTLQSKIKPNIFVLGDATDLPSSKAGSVAHFQAEVLTANLVAYIENRPWPQNFDGHANCFIESGFHKGFMVDFNYEQEPLPGRFPVPVIGPFALLKESWLNHLGKLLFRFVYWYVLLKGRGIPFVQARMSMRGKNKEIR